MPQVLSMKAEYLVLLSFLLTFAVVTNAFYTKKQFYPSVVYLTKSSTSLAVNKSLIIYIILSIII
jgi:E3 ubiquitin-protein ligase synoviolin